MVRSCRRYFSGEKSPGKLPGKVVVPTRGALKKEGVVFAEDCRDQMLQLCPLFHTTSPRHLSFLFFFLFLFFQLFSPFSPCSSLYLKKHNNVSGPLLVALTFSLHLLSLESSFSLYSVLSVSLFLFLYKKLFSFLSPPGDGTD